MATLDVSATIPTGLVEGYCDPAWQGVLGAFLENFHARDEVGASLCVKVAGKTLIDVWGGSTERDGGSAWNADTMTVVFSATKGAVATCAHVLASRGDLDLKAPVADYWPEFARNGKESATVEMMLNHSVGVPGFREPLKPWAFADWDYMIHRLEEEPAFWEPGLRCGYHLLNIGWTVGELIRRVSGKSLGTFFREEIAEPRDLEFWIGLPEGLEHKVAPFIPYMPANEDPLVTDFYLSVLNNPQADASKALLNTGGYDPSNLDPESGRRVPDTRIAHAAEIGGAGGITNGRGLAGLYDPLANGGGDLVSEDHLWRMSQLSMISTIDPILLMPTRFGLGYMKAMDNRHRRVGHIESLLIGDRAFGHVGAGGSLGFADPDCALAFGYSMNRMGAGVLLNERGQSLVDAVYRTLGYRSNAGGVWAR